MVRENELDFSVLSATIQDGQLKILKEIVKKKKSQ